MTNITLPPLDLGEWRETRDKLHDLARLCGRVRATLAPPQKHWWHITLQTTATGLTTTPMPARDRRVELTIDLTRHEIGVATSRGKRTSLPIAELTLAQLREALSEELSRLDVTVDLDAAVQPDRAARDYRPLLAADFWQALSWVDAVFERFKGGLEGESSTVQLFPHHFDLSLAWLSGRRVPDSDPRDEEASAEQMGFGFLTGDARIPEAYFYVIAYPFPEGMLEVPVPAGGVWHTRGFRGAVLPYARLRDMEDPEAALLEFLQGMQSAGARLMAEAAAS
jgi:hypothetical protein